MYKSLHMYINHVVRRKTLCTDGTSLFMGWDVTVCAYKYMYYILQKWKLFIYGKYKNKKSHTIMKPSPSRSIIVTFPLHVKHGQLLQRVQNAAARLIY